MNVWALGEMHKLMAAVFRMMGYDDDRAGQAATWLTVLVFITSLWIVSQVSLYG